VNNYRLSIQYDGGRYRGWQRLGRGENTIQAKLEQVLSRMIGRELQVIGSSRTDAGVHALHQVVNFRVEEQLAADEVKQYLNNYLPQDISVLEVISVPENFHARFHAKRKTYLYKLWNRDYPHPFVRKYSMHVPQHLNLSAMREAAQHFLGKHDFAAFSNAQSKKKTTVREIYSLAIIEDDGFVLVRVCGDGFLHNMVRKMVGALIAVGKGELRPVDVQTALASGQRGQVGPMADACGLYLEKIEF
jgi:tRNA pseudouridine38-40 synthase